MPAELGAPIFTLPVGKVLTRIVLLRRQGIEAMKVGIPDKTGFLISPFALFYVH